MEMHAVYRLNYLTFMYIGEFLFENLIQYYFYIVGDVGIQETTACIIYKIVKYYYMFFPYYKSHLESSHL